VREFERASVRAWRAVLDNPIVAKEIRETLATRRAAVMYALFTAALAAAVYVAWPRGEEVLQNIDLVARRLFAVVGTTMLVLVSLLAPAFSSVAVTGEKERRCFDLLVTTGLGEGQILAGKLLGALLFLGLLILSSAPMVSVCLLLGGIAPSAIAALYVLLFEVAVVFALVGLAASSLFERNNAALGVAYAVVLPALGGLLLLQRGGAVSDPAFSVGLLTYVVPGAIIALIVLRVRIRRPAEGRPRAEEEEDRPERIAGLVLDRRLIPDRWLAPPRRRDLLSDRANPVHDKELRSEIVGQGTLFLRVIIQIGLVLMIFPFTILYLAGAPALYFSYLACFTLLIAPAFACGMFTGEHENRTFQLLATTLLRPHQIVLGKFLVAVRLMLLLLGLLIAPTAPGVLYGQLTYAVQPIGAVLMSYALCLAWAVGLVTIALEWSLVSRRTTGALVGAYLTGAGLFFGPFLFAQIVASFTDLPQAWARIPMALSPIAQMQALLPAEGSSAVVLGQADALANAGLHVAAVLLGSLTLLGVMISRCDWTWRRRLESE
jgi:ABC-type transport system involved in multi-copper enzyme maturation permease subunit